MYVSDIMTTRLATIEPDDELSTVRRIFEQASFHHLLVIEKGRLLGVISDRDLLRQLSPFVGTPAERPLDETTLRRKAHQIMSRRLVTVAPEDRIETAMELLVSNRISCLPVVGPDQDLRGILSWRDLLRWCVDAMKQDPGR